MREWVPGKAFVFDDTIEHEAWNESDQLRVVLILDLWNPFLTQAEREMISALSAGVGQFYGTLPSCITGGAVHILLLQAGVIVEARRLTKEVRRRVRCRPNLGEIEDKPDRALNPAHARLVAT